MPRISKKKMVSKKVESLEIKNKKLLLNLAKKRRWREILDLLPACTIEEYLEKDKKGKNFLNYVKKGVKKKIYQTLNNDAAQPDCIEKQEVVLKVALQQGQLTEFDDDENLIKNCFFSYLLERNFNSFEILYKCGLTLNDEVPGCPRKNRFYDYYYEKYETEFLEYLIDNIDSLDEYGIQRYTFIADAIKAKVTLSDLDLMLSTGGVFFPTLELKRYIRSFPNKPKKTKILNTINLFANVNSKKQIEKFILKPFYLKVCNEDGNTVIHELAMKGHEEACIKLLERYQPDDPIYNLSQESIWHVAVRMKLTKLIRVLCENHKQTIDYANADGISPWELAVLVGSKKIAELLKDEGANTILSLNEQGQTLLHQAVELGNERLLKRCFDTNVSVDSPDVKGYSALYYAGLKDEQEQYNFLRKFPGVKKAEKRDLFNAVSKDDAEALRSLLEHGVNPNQEDDERHKPLDTARIHSHNEVAELLMYWDAKNNLSFTEIENIKSNQYKISKAVKSEYVLEVRCYQESPCFILSEYMLSGKRIYQESLSPWKSSKSITDYGKWKIITKNDTCYLILAPDNNYRKPEAVILLNSNGEMHLKFANLPENSLSISTYADINLEAFTTVNQFSISARNIVTDKECQLVNSSSLKLEAKNITLNGTVSYKKAEIIAKENFKHTANFYVEELTVKADVTRLDGQIMVAKQYSIETKGTFTHVGELVASEQGTIRANKVDLERDSMILTQQEQGSLKIYGDAKVTNSGAVIADQLNINSRTMITNNVGAMIKGFSCILHAPQVNQAGFLLIGQKSALFLVDWAFNGLDGLFTAASYLSYITGPQTVTCKGSLVIAKTIYRAGSLLQRLIEGKEIKTSELITIVLDGIVPSVAFLRSWEEQAKLLVNTVYQLMSIAYSEEKACYKGIEFMEALTKVMRINAGGLLSEDQVKLLGCATNILTGVKYVSKAFKEGRNIYRAWYSEDLKQLEIEQEKLGALAELVFREALYKLDPSQLFELNLGFNPIDIVNYILNQEHRSDLFLQSIVYGLLHAAQKAGYIEVEHANDLLLGTKILFRLKRWHKLVKDYQNNKLTVNVVITEALQSFMVVLNSERVQNYLNQSKAQDALPEENDLEQIESALSLVEDNFANRETQKLKEELGSVLLKSLIDIQKAINGEYAGHGYLGIFVGALHNEGAIQAEIAITKGFEKEKSSLFVPLWSKSIKNAVDTMKSAGVIKDDTAEKAGVKKTSSKEKEKVKYKN